MRYELSDYEWAAIKPMLPNKPRGVRRVNDRRVLNGIFWVLRSGAPWRDLPENFDIRPATIGSCAGGRLGAGTRSWKRWPPAMMRRFSDVNRATCANSLLAIASRAASTPKA